MKSIEQIRAEVAATQKEIEQKFHKTFLSLNYGSGYLRKNPPKSNKYVVRKVKNDTP